MVYYLAGPMTGYPLHNFQAFVSATRMLRAAGLEVITPVEIDQEIGALEVVWENGGVNGHVVDVVLLPGYNYEACLIADLEVIAGCDGVVLLPGWQFSAGARRELACAIGLDLEVRLASDLLGEVFS